MACVSIAQTVAENFVALTRRVAAELAVQRGPAATIIRHLYDVWAVRDHYDREEAVRVIPAIIPSDALAFGNQFPAHRVDPVGMTRAAVAALKANPEHANRIAVFQRDMVYSKRIEFVKALAELDVFLESIERPLEHHAGPTS